MRWHPRCEFGLRLGVPGPGGRGGPRGLPETFLTAVLLPPQDGAMQVFDLGRGLRSDPDESGRRWLGDALSAAARDPMMASVLERVQRKVDEAFTATGRPKRGADAPLTRLRQQLQDEVDELNQTLRARGMVIISDDRQ